MMSNDFQAIDALDLDPIKVKLMHRESGEGWSAARASAVEREYRRFLVLMKMYPGEPTSPTVDVDTFWHYHILDTMKYAVDCEVAFGYFLHHFPYVGMRGKEDEEALQRMGERMRAVYEETFGEDYEAAARRCAELAAVADPAEAAGNRGAGGGAAYCGVAAKAAYCGVAAGGPAYCGVAAEAAYCGVAAGGPAYCGVSAKAAYCGIPAARPAYCGVSATAAYCGIPAASPAYCGVAASAAGGGVTIDDECDDATALPAERRAGFYHERPSLN